MRRLLAATLIASALGGCVAVYGFDDFDTALPATASGDGGISPSLAALAPARLRRGAATTVAVSLERREEGGPITIEIDGFPPGIAAAPLVVPAAASTGTLALTALVTAPFGTATGVVRARFASGATIDTPLAITVVGSQLDPTFGNGGIILGSPGEALEAFALDGQGRAVIAVARTVGTVVYIDVYRDDGNGGFALIVELRTDPDREPRFALAAPAARIVTTQQVGDPTMEAVAYADDDMRVWSKDLGNTYASDDRPLFAFPSADDMVLVTKEAAGVPPREALILRHFGVADGGSAIDPAALDGPQPVREQPVAALATADGIVLCSTYDDGSSSLVRLRRIRDGRLDPTFGESGLLDLGETDAGAVRCVDLASSGGRVFVLTASSESSRVMSRASLLALDRTGALDTTFADAGIAAVGAPGIVPAKLALDPDGGVWIGAASFTADTVSTAVVIAMNASGAVDPTFGEGDGGRITVPVPGTSSADGVWRLADGRLLVVGALDLGIQNRWFIARYIP